MSSIWDFPYTLNPSQLRVGMVLKVRSEKDILDSYWDGTEYDIERNDFVLDYTCNILYNLGLTHGDFLTIEEMKDIYCTEGNPYVAIKFKGVPTAIKFIPFDNDYSIENLTPNELFEVVQ